MNFFILILLFSIGVHAYLKLDKKEQIHRLFLTLLSFTILMLFLTNCRVVLHSSNQNDFFMLQKMLEIVFFVLSPIIPILSLLYVYTYINKHHKIKINKINALTVPVVINGIISVANYHFSLIFSINSNNVYVQGPLFWLVPMVIAFYYSLNLMVLYNGRKKLRKDEFWVMGSLTFIPILVSGFQIYYTHYFTIWNSVAIAVVMNYVFVLHNMVLRDPLTGLGNRMAYDEYLANLKNKHNIIFSVINIDMDDFKAINDSFGHEEGDKVLRFFATQLETVFQDKGVAIRLGGDEFIVLLKEGKSSNLEQYIQSLQDKICIYNKKNKLMHPIAFSYGIAIFNDSYHNITELINYSDKLMYEEKKKKKHQR